MGSEAPNTSFKDADAQALHSSNEQGSDVVGLSHASSAQFEIEMPKRGSSQLSPQIDVAVTGARLLPCDMLFERVYSRAIMGVLVLMGLFRLASGNLMRTSSSMNCAAVGVIQDAPSKPWTPETTNDWLFWGSFFVVGLNNSLNFTRGCPKCVGFVGRILSLCAVTGLLVNSMIDLSGCTWPSEFQEFCGSAQSGPVARQLVSKYDESLRNEGGTQFSSAGLQRKLVVLVGDDDRCDRLVHQTLEETDCKQRPEACGETWHVILSETCTRVHKCFEGFMAFPTTIVRAAIWHTGLWMLFAALVWDALMRARFAVGRSFVQVGGTQVSSMPLHLHRLGRRVPLALLPPGSWAWCGLLMLMLLMPAP